MTRPKEEYIHGPGGAIVEGYPPPMSFLPFFFSFLVVLVWVSNLPATDLVFFAKE